jgi:hypothetical protein
MTDHRRDGARRPTPAKMLKATLDSSRILCGAWLPCRIPKSKLSSTLNLQSGQRFPRGPNLHCGLGAEGSELS